MIINSRKAMGIGQVFIFIVAAITFALIMIFGFKSITNFIDKGEQVEFVQFKNGLESSVKKIYTEYGSVRTETFNLPVRYEKICFVDVDEAPLNGNCEGYDIFDPVACSVWKDAQEASSANDPPYDKTDENVFLTPSAPVKIKVYKLDIDNEGKNYLCLDVVRGQFSLRLEGTGSETKLSKVPVNIADTE